MKAYFISGLAADSRVFKNIVLPAGIEMIHLHWIKPKKNESLEPYAIRLAANIDLDDEFILVGLSMGGMIASEISKKHPPLLTILISSVPSYKQFPFRFKIAYYLKLHKIVPASFLKSGSIIKRLFSSDDSADKMILTQVIKDSDPEFIRWALGAILSWKNEIIPTRLLHIHGTNDHILPIKRTNPTHIISKGGHLMVMSRAKELNIILEMLNEFQDKI